MADLPTSLLTLFDAETLSDGRAVSLADVTFGDLGLVHWSATTLAELASKPARQRVFAKGLDRRIAVLLCRWILDPESVRAVFHRPY